MFQELNDAFPQYTHFYTVSGMTMSEALDKCARLTGDNGHVFQYNGSTIFAAKHDVESVDIPWLDPVPGTPIDV